MILMLAGLQGIPSELREAAALDGASGWQATRRITLPLLGPTIRIWLFLTVVGSLQVFDQVWIMTVGGPANASSTMVTYLVQHGFQSYEFGYGSAVAVIIFLICFVFALLYQRFVAAPRHPRRPDPRGGVTDVSAIRSRPARPASARRHRGRRMNIAAHPGHLPGRAASSWGSPSSRCCSCSWTASGPTRRSTRSATGLPHPWVWSQLPRSLLTSSAFWQPLGEQRRDRGDRDRRWCSCSARWPRSPCPVTTFRGGRACSCCSRLGCCSPINAAALPLYLMLDKIGLLDNPLGVALPEAAFGLPITIVILRPFMRAIPGELEDAAVVDGATRIEFFLRILLPLSRPALVTVAVLAFVQSWNQYLLPLLVFTSQGHFTLPLAVANFADAVRAEHGRASSRSRPCRCCPRWAASSLLQRHLVGGWTGAVKG